MIQKISIYLLIVTFVFQELSAFDKRLSLDIARAKNVEKVVKRVNHIYEFINLFIKETGNLPTGMGQLTTRYGGIQTLGFSGGNITFTITNNIVTFSNVMATSESNFIKQLYTNHVDLHPFAVVASDLKMDILLDADAIGFLNKSNGIRMFDDDDNNNIYDGDDIFVQATEPSCNNIATDNSDMWYQPDGMGGFVVYYCLVTDPLRWIRISNKVDIAIYETTLGKLNTITPPAGTTGYVESGATNALMYVFDGTNWRRVVD